MDGDSTEQKMSPSALKPESWMMFEGRKEGVQEEQRSGRVLLVEGEMGERGDAKP